MSNQTAAILISSLLVAAGGAIPPLPSDSQSAPVFVPPLPEEPSESPVVPQIDDLTNVPPSRVGLVRDGVGSRVVPFSRIQGHADSCRCTTRNSPVGSRWLGLDGRTYTKLADGTFWLRPTAQQRAAGAGDTPPLPDRPVGNWGTVAATGFT